MKRYKKLIFVSSSDTCRSPMAEAIMKNKQLLYELEIESKGLVVLFPEPVNQKAEAILVSNGLSMKEHTSESFTAADLEAGNLVLTMEEKQRDQVQAEYDGSGPVYTLLEYLGAQGSIKAPLGGTLADYGECYETLNYLMEELTKKLNEEGA